MEKDTRTADRAREVRRIFEEFGFGNIELLEGWDGDEIEELADLLTEEEYETLLLQLQATED